MTAEEKSFLGPLWAIIAAVIIAAIGVALALESAYPQTRLNVIATDGVSDKDIRQLYRAAAPYFKRMKLPFRVKRLAEAHPCPELHTITTRGEELKCFWNDAAPYRRKKMITVYVTAPFEQNGFLYMAGIAYNNNFVATSSMIPGSTDALYRGAVAFAHEVAHSACNAAHIPETFSLPEFMKRVYDAFIVSKRWKWDRFVKRFSEVNLMNPMAMTVMLAYQLKELPVSRVTVRQCDAGWIKRRKEF